MKEFNFLTEEEKHQNCARSDAVGLFRIAASDFEQTAGDVVDYGQAKAADHQAVSSAKFIDNEGRDDCANDTTIQKGQPSHSADGKCIHGIDTAGQPILLYTAVTGLCKKSRRVGRDGSDSRPGGHYLEKEADPRSSTKMAMLRCRCPACQDVEELNRRRLLGESCSPLHLGVFGLNLWCSAASYVSEHFQGFLMFAGRRKISGRVRKHFYAGQDEESPAMDDEHCSDAQTMNARNALKCELESPADIAVTVVDKRESEIQPIRWCCGQRGCPE